MGLTLAARLVAIDSAPTVLVLEAGEAHIDNPDICTSLFGYPPIMNFDHMILLVKDRSGLLLQSQEYAYKHEWVIIGAGSLPG